MPILFPIALAGLIIIYITERLCMAYVYRRPPKYSERLTNYVLKILAFAPFCYICMAAWLYSNQQVFRNTVGRNDKDHLFPTSNHEPVQLFTQLTPGCFYSYVAMIVFVIFFLRSRSGCNLKLNCCKGDKLDKYEQIATMKSQTYFSNYSAGMLKCWYREIHSLYSCYDI